MNQTTISIINIIFGSIGILASLSILLSFPMLIFGFYKHIKQKIWKWLYVALGMFLGGLALQFIIVILYKVINQ